MVKRLVFLGLWRSRSSVVGGQGVSRRFSAVVAVAVLGAKARRPGSQEAGTAEPQKRKKPIWMGEGRDRPNRHENQENLN